MSMHGDDFVLKSGLQPGVAAVRPCTPESKGGPCGLDGWGRISSEWALSSHCSVKPSELVCPHSPAFCLDPGRHDLRPPHLSHVPYHLLRGLGPGTLSTTGMMGEQQHPLGESFVWRLLGPLCTGEVVTVPTRLSLTGVTAFTTTEVVGLLSVVLSDQQFLLVRDFAPQGTLGSIWRHFFVVTNVYVGAAGIERAEVRDAATHTPRAHPQPQPHQSHWCRVWGSLF